jgi:hypothetical protein
MPRETIGLTVMVWRGHGVAASMLRGIEAITSHWLYERAA